MPGRRLRGPISLRTRLTINTISAWSWTPAQHPDKSEGRTLGKESSHVQQFGTSRRSVDRRLPPRRGRPQSQRRRNHLRAGRHPDHRPRPNRPGIWHPLHRFPARNFRRQRRCRRRVPEPPTGCVPDDVRPRFSQRPARTGQRHHELLPDDPDLRIEPAADGGPAAGRLPGPRPAQRRKAVREGGLSDRPRRGHRARCRTRHSYREFRPPGRCLPRHPGRGPESSPRTQLRPRTRFGASSTRLRGSCRHRRRSIARWTCWRGHSGR